MNATKAKVEMVKAEFLQKIEALDFSDVVSKTPLDKENRTKLVSIVWNMLNDAGGDQRRIENMGKKAKLVVRILEAVIVEIVKPGEELFDDEKSDKPETV